MIFKLHLVDITQALAQKIQPIFRLERPKAGNSSASIFGNRVGRVGEFWVAGQLINTEEIPWSVTKKGDFVTVPMFAYTTTEQEKSLLVSGAMELGMRAGYDLACSRGGKDVLQATFVVGNKCDRVDGVYLFYVGIVVQVS